MNAKQKHELLAKECERLAREEESKISNPENDYQQRIEHLDAAKVYWQLAKDHEATAKAAVQFELNTATPFANQGKKNAIASSEGGKATAKITKRERDLIISHMGRYIELGQSIANAARLVFKAGIGTSPEANRKRWNRTLK